MYECFSVCIFCYVLIVCIQRHIPTALTDIRVAGSQTCARTQEITASTNTKRQFRSDVPKGNKQDNFVISCSLQLGGFALQKHRIRQTNPPLSIADG